MTKLDKSERERAVAFARLEIQEMDKTCRELEINHGETQYHQDFRSLLIQLSELKRADPLWVSHAEALDDLAMEGINRKFWRNIIPEEFIRKSESPFIRALHDHIPRAERSRYVYEALCSLGAGMVSDGQRMPFELRDFICKVLRNEIKRPRKTGRPKNLSQRDRFYYFVIDQISMDFGVSPTRNRASSHRDSACDIVAEAMPREGNRPDTYDSLVRIWAKGRKEDEAEDRNQLMDMESAEAHDVSYPTSRAA